MNHPLSSRRRAALAVAAACGLVTISAFVSAQESSNALRHADTLYRSGTAALTQHDLAAAQTDFEQALRLAPNAEPAHVALGVVLLNLREAERAANELRLALKLRPSDGTAKFNLAIAYQQLDQPAKALPLLAQIEAESRARKSPLTASFFSAFAHSLAVTGHLAQAVQQLKMAIHVDPGNAQLHD